MRARTVPIPLKIWKPSAPGLDFALIECLQCGGALDWHQPDAGEPDRLLGICETCGRWHLMGKTPVTDEDVLVLMPDPCEIPDAVR
jgi:hypothetical protein